MNYATYMKAVSESLQWPGAVLAIEDVVARGWADDWTPAATAAVIGTMAKGRCPTDCHWVPVNAERSECTTCGAQLDTGGPR